MDRMTATVAGGAVLEGLKPFIDVKRAISTFVVHATKDWEDVNHQPTMSCHLSAFTNQSLLTPTILSTQ
jgi:hypothetical protein